jgi:CCR4-NOT transcription complex subunit 1
MNTKYEIINLNKDLGLDKNNDSAIQSDSHNTSVIEVKQNPSTSNKDQLNIENLPSFVTVDETIFGTLPPDFNLRSIIAQALDKAITEIIPPVITRSVTIALITTRELALKDFSLEPDEKKLLRGTHLIVQNLSGSLALVTCREPLKLSI